MATVNGAISAHADDRVINYDTDAWVMGDDQNTMWFGVYYGLPMLAMLRFTLDAEIPNGATIDTALLKLYGYSDNRVTNFWVYVTESADAPVVNAVGQRPAWADSGGTTTYPTTQEGSGGVNHSSFNLTAYNNINVAGLVQHLVTAYDGIASGAQITFWASADDAYESGESSDFESSGYNNPPLLTITYTAGGGATNVVQMII